MKPQKSLRARAMDILSRRETSRLELQRKLAPYAEDADELQAVLDEFAQRNWQSDQRYAEMWVQSKSRKHGSLRLKQALAQKGVSAELIAEHLPDRDTELANALAVLQKKFKQAAQSPAEQQKQMRFLLYRGFSGDIALKALKICEFDNDNVF